MTDQLLSTLPPLYAWMGEDEFGSGKIGIKQGNCPAGYIPLVSTEQAKVARYAAPLNAQAQQYRKQIRLIRYVPQEVVMTLGGAE